LSTIVIGAGNQRTQNTCVVNLFDEGRRTNFILSI